MTKTKKRGWFRSGDDEEQGSAASPADFERPAPLPLPPSEPVSTTAIDAALDVPAILDAAGVARDDRERVDRARNLLQALPNGVSAPVRRQIVEAALTTFGVATDRIVEAAQKETAALEAFIVANQQATEKLLEEARSKISKLDQEIQRVRQAAEQAAASLGGRIKAAKAEVTTVQHVLDFFGVSGPETELDETTEDRGMDWGVQLPVPPPARPARDTATTRPPPLPPADIAAKQMPAEPPASEQARGPKPQN